ncbi:hypothetical protein [Mycobacterium gordonae]|uniref:hypothetical protein n=1 Tax=Mycobacterium gordonae TaxID=1778 RepID=UPI000A14FB07|nr:hypothetical protein [Mycobacterium gordonae]MCV7004603.1 hypothetical protein [Mycobacterium gordonae]
MSDLSPDELDALNAEFGHRFRHITKEAGTDIFWLMDEITRHAGWWSEATHRDGSAGGTA